MRNLLFFLFLLVSLNGFATRYHFNASTVGADAGNDSYTPLQAQNSATPWRTIHKLDSCFPSLVAGDSLLLKRGTVFFTTEAIVVGASGNSSSQIVIAAYGTGADPVVSGLTNLIFSSLGGNKYASQALGLTNINLVAQNGQPQRLARYPNWSTIPADSSGYFAYHVNSYNTGTGVGTIRRASGANIILDGAVPPYSNTGSEMAMRETNWVINTAPITSHNATTVTFDQDLASPYDPNNPTSGHWGCWLQNDSAFLDQNGEWWQTTKTTGTTANRIIYYSSTGSPTGVVAATTTTLLTCASFDYVTFDNIDFEGSNSYMVNFTNAGGSHITLQNCTMNLSGETVVYDAVGTTGSSATDVLINNCVIKNSMNCGIFSNSARTKIKNTTLNYIGMLGGMGSNEINFSYCGVEFKAGTGLFDHSKIDSVGGTGISIRRFQNADTIQYSVIKKYGFIKKDLGAIYYFGKSNTTPNTGRLCSYNIVYDAIGGLDGSTNTNLDCYALYFDEQASGVVAKHNTFYNSGRGIMLNPGTMYCTIDSNTCYNNSMQQAYISTGENPALGGNDSMMRNIQMKKNIYYSTAFVQEVTQFIQGTNSARAWNLNIIGTNVNNNFFLCPVSGAASSSLIIDTTANSGANISLASWKTKHISDANSTISPYSYTSAADQAANVVFLVNEGNNSSTTGFPGIILTDIFGITYTSFVTVPGHSSIIAFKTGTVIGTPSIIKLRSKHPLPN